MESSTNYELSASLMPSNKHNLIMAGAIGLIISLLDVASTLQVPFGIPQYVQCMQLVLLCVPFLFADSPKCQFMVAQWLPYRNYPYFPWRLD